MASATINHKTLNRWVSRIIPLVLLGIVGYVTWVVVVLVCSRYTRGVLCLLQADLHPVKYLLKPPTSLHTPRHGAAIALLVLYIFLLLLMSMTYFRLVYIVTSDPGYVERSAQWYAQQEHKQKTKASRTGSRIRKHSSEKGSQRNGSLAGNGYTSAAAPSSNSISEQRPSLKDFFKQEVFICQGDGRPVFCSRCQNWKPDRAHHCREVDRCVRKMDHYCPWVGGIVSETSFKFFIQFVGWTAIFCIFNLILMAVLTAEYVRDLGTTNPHWVATLGFAALFGLFAIGMTGSSLQFAIVNTTTIENLSRKSVVYQLAIHMPQPPQEPPVFPTITFSTAQSTEHSTAPSNATKTFAILHSKPGENPWDLGAYENFKSVMGEHWIDWLLPIKYSPCCDHQKHNGQFAMGSVVQRMRREAGIMPYTNEEKPHRSRKHRRRRRSSAKSSRKWQNEKVTTDEETNLSQRHDRIANGHGGHEDGVHSNTIST